MQKPPESLFPKHSDFSHEELVMQDVKLMSNYYRHDFRQTLYGTEEQKESNF